MVHGTTESEYLALVESVERVAAGCGDVPTSVRRGLL